MCILCVLLYENYDDLLAYPYQNNELILICKHNAAAAMGEDRAEASKWRRAEARASDAGLSVCKHERREDEKVCRKGKQCRQQWCWTAVPAAAATTSLGKKSRKIPQLIYVIHRTMALLLMQFGLDSIYEVYDIHL